MNAQSNIVIKAYTHKQLASLYGVSWPTLKRWIKEYEDLIGKKNGHFYKAKQVAIMFECIGWPETGLHALRKAS